MCILPYQNFYIYLWKAGRILLYFFSQLYVFRSRVYLRQRNQQSLFCFFIHIYFLFFAYFLLMCIISSSIKDYHLRCDIWKWTSPPRFLFSSPPCNFVFSFFLSTILFFFFYFYFVTSLQFISISLKQTKRFVIVLILLNYHIFIISF